MNHAFSMFAGLWSGRRQPLRRQLARVAAARDAGIARKFEEFNRALEAGDETAIQRTRVELEHYLEVVGDPLSLLAQLQGNQEKQAPAPVVEVVAQDALPVYWISSSTLARAHQLLTRSLPNAGQEPEWMLAVTGLRRETMRTLEQLIEIQMDTQSAARASFDMDAFTRVAIALHKHGQALHAIFHSHRFNGAPNPSSVDWRLQEQLDAGGYPCIQAVFSEDAHVRFFARKPFGVEVYGKGVEALDRPQHLYRIVFRGALPDPGHAALGAERSDGLRSLPAHSRG